MERLWKFNPLDDITSAELQELNKELGYLAAQETDSLSSGLARHFIHKNTGERGVGTVAAPVDPNEAYNRAMKAL